MVPIGPIRDTVAAQKAMKAETGLISALLEMLGSRRIEQITVSELTDSAAYSRSTFYSRHRNKDGFLRDVVDDEARRYTETMLRVMTPNQHQSRAEYVTQVTLPLYEHVWHARTLYVPILDDSLFPGATEYLCERVIHRAVPRMKVLGVGANIELTVYGGVSHYLATLRWWARSDFSQPANYMAEQASFHYTNSALWIARA